MTDYSGYESGPFCQHWGEPGDCVEKCVRCGHTCNQHGGGYEECEAEGCDCPEIVLPER